MLVAGRFFTVNRSRGIVLLFPPRVCSPLSAKQREREKERGGETRAGYTSVTSLLSAQTHDPPRLTTLTINSQGSPKHLDRARYISIINVANSGTSFLYITRNVGMFSATALFQQVYTVARKHGETLWVVKKTVSYQVLMEQKELSRRLINSLLERRELGISSCPPDE